MATYVDNIRNPPRTLTEVEQHWLLKVSGEHKAGFRDHLLFSLALGTGLREHEILALDVGDVFDDGKSRRRLVLRWSYGGSVGQCRVRRSFEHRKGLTCRTPNTTTVDSPRGSF